MSEMRRLVVERNLLQINKTYNVELDPRKDIAIEQKYIPVEVEQVYLSPAVWLYGFILLAASVSMILRFSIL